MIAQMVGFHLVEILLHCHSDGSLGKLKETV